MDPCGLLPETGFDLAVWALIGLIVLTVGVVVTASRRAGGEAGATRILVVLAVAIASLFFVAPRVGAQEDCGGEAAETTTTSTSGETTSTATEVTTTSVGVNTLVRYPLSGPG
jgi:hypothetical protein